MRGVWAIVAVVGCAGGAVVTGEKAPTTAASTSTSTTTTTSTSASLVPAVGADGKGTDGKGVGGDGKMPVGCQAPLQLAQEAHRLLVAAAAHATRSASCVDGPGRHVTIEQVHVCPGASTGKRTTVRAAYRVRVQGEGDTRACGKRAGDCAWREPKTSEHTIELSFTPTKAGLTIELPASVPGIDDMTPLASAHDGDCYGGSDPFVPQPIRR